MDQSDLIREQRGAHIRADKEAAPTDDAAIKRAEFLADLREQRSLQVVQSAVFWGTLKAHAVMAIIGVGAWLLVVYGFAPAR